MSKKKDLVQIIKDNPNCVAMIDNDCWTLYKNHPYEDNPFCEGTGYDKWIKRNKLVCSDDELENIGGGGYGLGNCYGREIFEALAIIAGVTVDGV